MKPIGWEADYTTEIELHGKNIVDHLFQYVCFSNQEPQQSCHVEYISSNPTAN